MTRFGWLAAAAAMVLGAGQAQAARYYEFQVTGIANRPDVYKVLNDSPGNFRLGIYTLTYTSVDTFAFDTASLPAVPNTSEPGWNGMAYPYYFHSAGTTSYQPYAYAANYGIELESYSRSSRAYIDTYTLPGGPDFSFSFAFSDVAAGDTLQPLWTGDNAFAYIPIVDGRGPYVAPTDPGQIVSVLARTTDVAPSSLRATEHLVVTVLPEPASWAMMIGGFGLAGGAMRRSRRSKGKAQGAAALA